MTYSVVIPAEEYVSQPSGANVSQSLQRLNLAGTDEVVVLDPTPGVPDLSPVSYGTAFATQWPNVSTGGRTGPALPWMFATNNGSNVFTLWVTTGVRAQTIGTSGGYIALVNRSPVAATPVRIDSLLAGAAVLVATGATDPYTSDPVYRRATYVGDTAVGIGAMVYTDSGSTEYAAIPPATIATSAASALYSFRLAQYAGTAPNGTVWFDLSTPSPPGGPLVHFPVASSALVALSTIARGTRNVIYSKGSGWGVIAEIL